MLIYQVFTNVYINKKEKVLLQALRYLELGEKEGEIPYYAFRYQGFTNSDLKLRTQSLRKNRQQIAKLDKSTLREWFFNETHNQLDRTGDYFRFSKAILIVVHHFSTAKQTDLDNYDYKYMIDAIKSLQIIEDDSFQHLELYTTGVQDSEDGIECYLIPKGYLTSFLEKCTVQHLQQVKAKITPINEQILSAEREHLLDESKFF